MGKFFCEPFIPQQAARYSGSRIKDAERFLIENNIYKVIGLKNISKTSVLINELRFGFIGKWFGKKYSSFEHNNMLFWFLTALVLVQFFRLMTVNLYSYKLQSYIYQNNTERVLGATTYDPLWEFTQALSSDFKDSDLPRTGN